MIAATSEPALAVVLSGLVLLAVLFAPLVISEWRAVRKYWSDFRSALEDARKPLP